MRRAPALLLILGVAQAQWATSGMGVRDEGAWKGYAQAVNCTGAGVTCSSNGYTWTLNVTGGAGGSPGGLAGNLQTNDGAGGFGAYGGATCTAPSMFQAVNASGASTCYTLLLDDLGNPSATKTFTMANKALKFTWAAPSPGAGIDGAMELEATGGYTGDLLHVHQHTGSPVAGVDLIHAEAASSNVLPLRLTAASSVAQAATITGAVTASSLSLGSPLPAGSGGGGAVLPTCTGTQKLTANGTSWSCTADQDTVYTLPAASTTLGGVKMASACGAGNHVSSIGAGGELTCSADAGGGGGSPGGSTTQVQYNNAGAFGGMSGTLTDGAYLVHVGTTTHPAAPSADQVKQYAFQHHGGTGPALMQFVDGDAQMEQSVTPFTAAYDYRWGCVAPAGASNTTLISTGFTTAAATGTAAAVAWSVTDERTRHFWIQYPTAATANTNAGVRANADMVWRGNAAGLGGFYVWGAMNIVTTNGTQRVFMGLKDATAVLTATADPNAALDTVYFGCNAADTNLSVCSNDATTTATCTTLGANFPCKTANVAYDWAFWAQPNGSTIGYYIRRLANGSEASGSLSTDLPRNTVALGWDMTVNSGANLTITTMQFGGVCYVANP